MIIISCDTDPISGVTVEVLKDNKGNLHRKTYQRVGKRGDFGQKTMKDQFKAAGGNKLSMRPVVSIDLPTLYGLQGKNPNENCSIYDKDFIEESVKKILKNPAQYSHCIIQA